MWDIWYIQDVIINRLWEIFLEKITSSTMIQVWCKVYRQQNYAGQNNRHSQNAINFVTGILLIICLEDKPDQ